MNEEGDLLRSCHSHDGLYIKLWCRSYWARHVYGFSPSRHRFFRLWDTESRSIPRGESICLSQKKKLQVVHTTEAQPPYVFGNFPKAEVQFMCLDANDSELVRPKLRKEADTVIEMRK